jgi:Ca2+-binding RTX toxin-like protein
VTSAPRLLTQGDFDNGSVTNIATDQGTGGGKTVTATDTDTVTLQQNPVIDVEKLVSVDGGATFTDADTAPGPTLLSGSDPVFKFVVTNTGNVTLTNVTLHDDKFDLNGAATGTDLTIGTLAPGVSSTPLILTEPFESGQHTDTATATGTPPSGPNVTDSDPANYFGAAPPIVTQGTPQFNFPNSVDQIQPKVGGGASFTFNPGGYIYWDLYSHDVSKAQIALNSGTSQYPNLSVSIVQVWGSNGIGANTGEGIYRVYVTDNTPNTPVSLTNSQLIVSYSIVNGQGQPALSTDKGIIDLINSDPLIGNFNNFNNIENALTKASNGFTINPSGATGTAGVDKDWTSADTTGTATGEAAKTFDAAGGNDALYGRSNTSPVGDTLSGGAGNNLVDGRAGNDVIDMSASTGNNYLYGGLGNDVLKGGSGNDTLVGSYGVDTLTGNGGSDVFILQRGGIEKITDFTPGTDKLWVGTFNGTATPGATFSALGLAGAPAGTDAVYDKTTGNFYFDPDGTGAGVDPVLVAVLSPNLNITSADVVIDPAAMVQAIAGAQLSGNSGGALSNVLPTAQDTPWQQHALAGSTG